MASVQAKIHIEANDTDDIQAIVSSIKSMLSSTTGLDTQVNIIKIDDPMALSPTRFNPRKITDE